MKKFYLSKLCLIVFGALLAVGNVAADEVQLFCKDNFRGLVATNEPMESQKAEIQSDWTYRKFEVFLVKKQGEYVSARLVNFSNIRTEVISEQQLSMVCEMTKRFGEDFVYCETGHPMNESIVVNPASGRYTYFDLDFFPGSASMAIMYEGQCVQRL